MYLICYLVMIPITAVILKRLEWYFAETTIFDPKEIVIISISWPATYLVILVSIIMSKSLGEQLTTPYRLRKKITACKYEELEIGDRVKISGRGTAVNYFYANKVYRVLSVGDKRDKDRSKSDLNDEGRTVRIKERSKLQFFECEFELQPRYQDNHFVETMRGKKRMLEI